jgi:hypothetical protein
MGVMRRFPSSLTLVLSLLWLASCRGPDVVAVPVVAPQDAEPPPKALAQAPPEPDGGGAFAIVRREPVALNACDLGRAVASLGRGCERFPAMEVAGPRPPGATQAAFDGDGCTIWNAGGFPPQTAAMDLGAPAEIAAFLLLPEMTPNGQASHAIETSIDGRAFQRMGQVQAPMQTGVLYEMVLPEPVLARFVRVVTTQSPSWVAWRDIVAVRCD